MTHHDAHESTLESYEHRMLHYLGLYFSALIAISVFTYTNLADVGPVAVESAVGSVTSQHYTGVTPTHNTFDSANSQAVERGKSYINETSRYVNVHLMGFGASNPNPSPGTYNWTTLDTKFNSQFTDSDTIVLTACCAPGWMKDDEDFNEGFATAPLPEHYDEYADLVATAVSRYPQIEYVQVWNEMKGFFDHSKSRWNYEGYTDMYNQIYAAVKDVRPSVKVGGPYPAVRSNGTPKTYDSDISGAWGTYDQRDLDVITYWLANKNGADFITIDGSNQGRDKVATTDDFSNLAKHKVLYDWIRDLNPASYPGANTLPIWWAEWYARPENSADSIAKKNALMSAGLAQNIKTGFATTLIWAPEGDAEGLAHPLGIFTDTVTSSGGQKTLLYDTQYNLHTYFSAGAKLIDLTDNTSIETLATASKMMLVNKTSTTQTTKIYGKTFSLSGYEVLFATTPSVPTDTKDDEEKPKTDSSKGSSKKTDTTTDKEETTSDGGTTEKDSEKTDTEDSTTPDEEGEESLFSGLLKDDKKVKIGSVDVPTKPIILVSSGVFVATLGSLAFVERKIIQAKLPIVLGKVKGLFKK